MNLLFSGDWLRNLFNDLTGSNIKSKWFFFVLLIFKDANCTMTADPVVGVAAETVELKMLLSLLIVVDIHSTGSVHSLDLLELFGSHEDLLLRNLDDGAIKVLEEEPVFLEHTFLNLEDLNEVHFTLDAELIFDETLLRNDSVVTLFGAGDHPLEIL